MTLLDPRFWIVIALAAVALASGSALVGYHHGVKTTDSTWSARWEKRNATDLAATVKIKQQAEATEQAHQKRLAEVDQHYQEIIKNDQIAHDRDIARIRAGTLKLRQRFTCNTAPSSGLPQAATAAGGSDGAAPGGLRPADAEVLVQFADRCDTVAHQLQSAQAIILSDRSEEGAKP